MSTKEFTGGELMPEDDDILASEHFFLTPVSEVASPLEAAAPDLPQEFKPIFSAFAGNLSGAALVARLPYSIALDGVRLRILEAMLRDERVRRIKHEDIAARMIATLKGEPAPHIEQSPAELESIMQSVMDQFRQEFGGQDGNAKLDREVKHQLTGFLKQSDIQPGTKDLLRQSLVLAWGALEVLATDVFVKMLNMKPSLTSALVRDEATRKYFQLKDFTRIAEEYSYDLSDKMGDILASQHRMDDAQSIRAILNVLVPSDDLRGLLGEPFWKLGQRRNLVVHRRSVVDDTYAGNTGDSTQIGTELVITPQYLKGSLELARNIGVSLGKGLFQHFPPTS